MCGIIGVASTTPVRSRDWLATGRDALAHRGPDDVGSYWSEDGRIGFGHRRLSIIDLSAAGHQPMSSADRQIWISYNGEIYNYRELRLELESKGHSFRSSSDTEVVIAAYRQWGMDFLAHLDGMFAIALHDNVRSKVVLARDRAGEKPLFYRHRAGELRFASELKGLFADEGFERVVNLEALDCYLGMGYIPGERCMLDGVSKLPPAHAAAFDCTSGTLEVWRYWELPPYRADQPSTDLDTLVAELEAVLERAVRRQLVADVPVGLLLSGGVDSSLITALAARADSQLKTYTVGFPEFSQYDETPHAALVAGHFGTDHTVLQADHVGPEILDRLARQYDEPMIDSSMIPTFLVSEQIRRHCKVALGGDGGDELFGGYYSASYAARLQRMLSGVPLWPRQVAAYAAMRLVPAGMRGRNALRILATDIKRDVLPATAHFDAVARARLFPHPWSPVAEGIRAARVPATSDAVQRMTRFDFQNYMAEDILVKVDRASMLNSLEVRAPFLDRTVVEFAYGRVPTHLKATPHARKIILRKLAHRILPEGFDAVRKQGFSIPLDRWLRQGPWRTHFEEVLFDPGCVFSRRETGKLFGAIDKGGIVGERLFGLVLFEKWRRHYSVDVQSAH